MLEVIIHHFEEGVKKGVALYIQGGSLEGRAVVYLLMSVEQALGRLAQGVIASFAHLHHCPLWRLLKRRSLGLLEARLSTVLRMRRT